jgi:hypothetical protein
VYAGASPVKRPKPEGVFDKEIIEEIIFHHPTHMLSSPSKYFVKPKDSNGIDEYGFEIEDSIKPELSVKPSSKLKDSQTSLRIPPVEE